MKTRRILLSGLLALSMLLTACSFMQTHETPRLNGSDPVGTDPASSGTKPTDPTTTERSYPASWSRTSAATEPEEDERDVRHRVIFSFTDVQAAGYETVLALPLDGSETGLTKNVSDKKNVFVAGEYAVAPNGHIIVADYTENKTVFREYADGELVRTLTDPAEVGERPLWKCPTFRGDTFCAALYDYAMWDPIYLMGGDGVLAFKDEPWNKSHDLLSVRGTAAGHLILQDGGYGNSRTRIVDAAGNVLFAEENLSGSLTEDGAGNRIQLAADDDTTTVTVTSPAGEPLSVCELLKPEDTYLFWSLIGADERGNVYLLADPTSNMTNGYPDVYLIRLDPMTGEAHIASMQTLYVGLVMNEPRLQVTPDGTVYRSECSEADGYRILRFDPWDEE